MNKFFNSAIVAIVAMGGASASQAALISFAGPNSSAGSALSIIAAPASIAPSGARNTGIQAFNEQQFATLASALAVDGGTIAAGTVVSSHMIFLNSSTGAPINHGTAPSGPVSFSFDGVILGVMSDTPGALEAASQYLGAAGTAYPSQPFNNRGLDPFFGADFYNVSGTTINLGMRGSRGGDWIRVVTLASVTNPPVPMPLPGSFLLVGSALAGLGVVSRRRRKAV